MKIYIDNKESQINAKRFKSLGNLITNISKKLEVEEKIIENIKLNGLELSKFKHINLNNDENILEISTKSFMDITIQNIYNIKDSALQIIKFIHLFNSIDLTNFEDDYVIENINSQLDLHLDFLHFLIYNYPDNFNNEFKNDYKVLALECKKLEDAYNISDYQLYSEIISKKPLALIEKFIANSQKYVKYIIENENNKIFQN